MSTEHPRNEHLRTWEALPWVANGRATPEQAAMVAAHVAVCPDCRSELDWQHRLHAVMQEAGETEDAATEAGLQRLLTRLDAPPEQQPASPPRAGQRLTWALAAAVVVQAVGLGVMGARLGWRADGAPASPAGYQTLTSAAAGPLGATLRVLPDTRMTLSSWQALLEEQGLQVLGGPNSVGAYALGPAPGRPAAPSALAAARLRAAPGIRLAEALGSTP